MTPLRSSARLSLLLGLTLAFAPACGGDDAPDDAGTKMDTGTNPDGGTPDTGTDGGGPVDTGTDGGGPVDTGVDGGTPDTGMDGGVVQCTTNDNLAGTPENPADLVTVANGTNPLFLCPDELDAFQVTAAAGDLLVITMTIDGPGDTGGVDDLDLVLYQGPVANDVAVDGSAGTTSTEFISFAVETAGTYVLVVEGYESSSVGYTLSFERGTACDVDADCTTGQCITKVTDAGSLLKSCEAWTTPTCGQQGPEDATDNHSDSTAVAFSSVATNGSVTGQTCLEDVDVFTFSVATGESLLVELGATVPADLLVGALVADANGDGLAVVLADPDTANASQIFPFILDNAGTYSVTVLTAKSDPAQTGPSEFNYDLSVSAAAPCHLDAACAGGTVCGYSLAGSGPLGICVQDTPDACGTNDGDNSQGTARTLATGVAADQSACVGNLDYYRVTMPAGTSQLDATLTWTGDSDLDVYLLGPDGSAYGAGWLGTNSESIQARSLPGGVDYFLVVDVFGAGTGAPTTAINYQLTATFGAGTACTDDMGCMVGGTTDTGMGADPQAQLSCTTGLCTRPGTANPFNTGSGNGCFEAAGFGNPSDCDRGLCALGVCTGDCTTGGQTQCDSTFSGSTVGSATCMAGFGQTGTDSLCVPNCGSALWGAMECQAVFGAQSMCDANNVCTQ